MAEIVIGLACPNTPLLVLDPSQWEARAAADRRNTKLVDAEGRFLTYDELAQRNGDRYAQLASLGHFTEQAATATKALDRMAQELEQAKPDIVLLISHDNSDLLTPENQPMLCIYYGEKMVTKMTKLNADSADWMRAVALGQGQDAHHEFTVASEFARELIFKLMAQGCDTASANDIPDPENHGFGYTFSFPIVRLMGRGKYPVVPVIINALLPPNQMTPKRCYEVGVHFKQAIAAMAPNTRVAAVTSAGMCHFVVNEELDRKVLKALHDNDGETLRNIPARLLAGTNGQIRDFIMMAGLMSDHRVKWSEYIPVYRTPAGTGIGIAALRW